MKIQTTGAFRIVKRTATHYELFFKHFGNGIMIQVAGGLTYGLAQELKEQLNGLIFGDVAFPDTEGGNENGNVQE